MIEVIMGILVNVRIFDTVNNSEKPSNLNNMSEQIVTVETAKELGLLPKNLN